VNVGFHKWGDIRVMGFKLLSYRVWYFFYLSSLYLCVFDDDHVTRYMGANVDAGEHVNT